MNWYYVDGGQQCGPVTDGQLDELLESGKITLETLIWREGLPDWQPYRVARPAAAPAPLQMAPPPREAPPVEPKWPAVQKPGAVCVECGKMFDLDEMIRHGNVYVCANCKPIFLQKLGEGAKIRSGELEYAGFWIRFVAKMVDGLIVGLVFVAPILILLFVFAFNTAANTRSGFNPQTHVTFSAASNEVELIGNLLGLVMQLVVAVGNIAYCTFFLGKYGATPGKMVCNLKVVDAEGNRMGYGRALGRSCAELLSQMICDIGYIIAAFDGQKRTLHDHICSTRVVYK